MNASRLREIVDKLLSANKRRRIQKLLDTVHSALNNLVASPSDPTRQREFSTALEALRVAIDKLRQDFQPTEMERISELVGGEDYLENIAETISQWMAENAATPAVAQERVGTLVQDRNAFVTNAEQLSESLKAVGIEAEELQPGEAEIGFLLPRELFMNEFDKLIKELHVVNRIIRAFSEVATGSAEKVEVRQISTTDPIFSLGMCAATIIAIGRAVTWALDTWKKVEEIRQIRAQTAQVEALKGSKFDDLLNESITKTIETEVEKKVTELVDGSKADDGRKNEQKIDLRWALESILARVERGMSVEIRLLPPPIKEAEDGEEPEKEPPEYQTLREVANALVFPSMTGDPVLDLPSPEPKKSTSKGAAGAS